jgi:cation diffusion facilitator CzcD-associated flavoprotein CzcO
LSLDVVIVGAGFAGVYLLHQLRQEGFKAKIVEASHGLGGVWYSNSYPGARVDTPIPTYALNIPEVYETWTWSEVYPGEQEIKAYFRHIDNVLNISKDVIYGEKIINAAFDEATDTWRLESDQGTTLTSQFFCPCLGFASKRYSPDWPGLLDKYKGQIVYPNLWPSEGLDLRGKKVALVGTGATGIQIAQEVAPLAEQMDKDHVTLVDVNANPVTHVVSNGIVTADGAVHEADIIILATDYGAITGGFGEIDITGLNGRTLEDKWSDGTHSYLGLTISGFPNMLYAYGPLSPSSYGTGPAVVESQSHWMVNTIKKMKAEGATRIDAMVEGEHEWRQKVDTIHAYTLRDNVEGSWYLG